MTELEAVVRNPSERRQEHQLTIHFGAYFPAHARAHEPEMLIGRLVDNDTKYASWVKAECSGTPRVFAAHSDDLATSVQLSEGGCAMSRNVSGLTSSYHTR